MNVYRYLSKTTVHNFETYGLFLVFVEVFSRDTSQNTHLTLEIQTLTGQTIINRDIMNRGQIATLSFPHSPLLKSHQSETILRSSP